MKVNYFVHAVTGLCEVCSTTFVLFIGNFKRTIVSTTTSQYTLSNITKRKRRTVKGEH